MELLYDAQGAFCLYPRGMGSSFRDLCLQFVLRRQKLMQRRVKQPNRHRKAIHGLKNTGEVTALHGQELLQRELPILLVLGHNHGLHNGQPFRFHKHMFRATKPDPLSTEALS